MRVKSWLTQNIHEYKMKTQVRKRLQKYAKINTLRTDDHHQMYGMKHEKY